MSTSYNVDRRLPLMGGRRYATWIVVVVLGCGDNRSLPIDAPVPPDAPPTPGAGIELGVLPPRTPTAPFAHTMEVSLAARGNTVVAAYINLADSDPTTYDPDGATDKRVGIAVSVNRGATFSAPIDPETTTQMSSSDPVIRSASDGTFWFTTIGHFPLELAVARSVDGLSWQTVYTTPAGDKDWFALDDVSMWVGSGPDLHRIDFSGSSLGQASSPYSQVAGAYVDGDGAHFGYFAGQLPAEVPIVLWDGSSPPVLEGVVLPVGGVPDPENYTSTISMGALGDGRQWIVRTVQRDGMPAIVLRIRDLPDEGEDLPISEPGAHAFLPAAIVDEDGRLRVVYYDSSGERGVLRTTRSVSNDWSEGFEASSIVDPDATPGGRWFPMHEAGVPDWDGRRLREYIDLALTSRRVHVAWTHSPQSPSRVRTTYIDY